MGCGVRLGEASQQSQQSAAVDATRRKRTSVGAWRPCEEKERKEETKGEEGEGEGEGEGRGLPERGEKRTKQGETMITGAEDWRTQSLWHNGGAGEKEKRGERRQRQKRKRARASGLNE